jgi:integrase
MLTILDLKKLKPKDKKYEVTDQNGLLLQIYPSGAMSWRLNKSVSGKRITKTLGSYPELGLKAARALAEQIVKDATPAPAAPDDVFILQSIYNDWLELKKTQIKNWRDNDLRMQKYILPVFGKRRLDSITPIELINTIKKTVASRGKLETVKRLCGVIRQVEVWAVNTGRCDNLKLQKIDQAFAKPSTQLNHRPSVHPDELPEVLSLLQNAALKANNTWSALLIGFYTLLRPGEYCAMRWDWVKESVIEVPADAMKMKTAHVVPITRQLQAVLDQRPKVTEFVLPSPDKAGAHIRPESLELFMRRHGLKDRLVPHGIRSIGRVWMHEAGIDNDVAELCLAHKVGSSVRQAYDRTTLLDQRVDAMQRWCDFVERCLKS